MPKAKCAQMCKINLTMLIWSAFINWITAIPWVSKSLRDQSSVAVIAATLIFSRIINVLKHQIIAI